MRLSLTLILILASVSVIGQSSYELELEKDRAEKDEELKSKKHSPLLKKDRKRFDHLNYYDVDESWNKTAQFSLVSNGEVLDIMTSSGKIKQFQTYGLMIFDNGERNDSLYAYKRIWPEGFVSPYAPSLFVPFKDMTTGEETYGGGRYMDIEIPEEKGEIQLDFNRCYNPYCAYGGGFSCPIPPVINFVNVKVEAGEKQYDEH